MDIAVLGPLQVRGGADALAPRDRVVLSALAMHVGELVPAERLAEALWGEEPPATWNKALQGSVVRLRKLLGADAIQTVGHGYRLSLPPSEVDAREFERLVGRAKDLMTRSEPDRAAYAVRSALDFWRGPPLADLEDWEPGGAEAARLEELRRDAEELDVDAALRSGRHSEVLPDARRLVEQAPLRERRWELLALAQYRCGQQADALRTLQQLRRVLVSELGLDPGHEALALEQAILRQDPELLPRSSAPVPSPRCPYLGLVPYDVGDAEVFHGRAAEVEACRRRLLRTGVLAVVGPSGVGKSSLVRAGLTAALRRDGQRVVVVTPGHRPLEALGELPDHAPAVLVVDQAEEAVMLAEDPPAVAEFFAALARQAARGGLVIALRADRFGDLAAHEPFARLVERGLYVLTPMTGSALREAVEAPARQAGLRLEAGLVELLVAEVEGQPGALPYLSHALRQTWERREGGVLTLEGYRATGGIRDAIARSAERVYDDLPAPERTMLRDLVLRLVGPGPEGHPVRSSIPRRILPVDPAHDRVLERLVSARLVTSDEGVVELAHEALARAWPRLQGWLDEDADGQRILRHLSVAADTWQGMGRPDDELYRGARLTQALEWRERSAPDLTPVEADFLAASDRRARQEEQSALDRAADQARVNRRLSGLLVAVVSMLAAAVVAGTLAARQATVASEATDTANARRVTAQAQLAGEVDRALMLAAAAFVAEPTPQSTAGLLDALSRVPQLARVLPVRGVWMATSPDGDLVATLDLDHVVRFYDGATYEQVGEHDPYPDRSVDGIGGNVEPLEFSPDGTVLAVNLLTVDRTMIELVDTRTFRPLREQPGGQPHHAHPQDPAFSPDGRYLAVTAGILSGPGAGTHPLFVWDLERAGRPLHRVPLPSDTFHLEFSPDGRRIHAMPGFNSDVEGAWSVATRTGEIVGHGNRGGQGIEASPDGTLLAYARGATVFVTDETTGRVLQRLKGPGKQVWAVAFSPDASLVAATSEDPAAYVWEVDTGLLRDTITLGNTARAVGFDSTGGRLLVPKGGRTDVFDLTGRDRYVERLRMGSEATRAAFAQVHYSSPYAPVVVHSHYVIGRGVNRAVVRERFTGRLVSRLGRAWSGDMTSLHAWSPDGAHLAYLDEVGRLRVWDWRDGSLVASRRAAGVGLAYTSDGSRLYLSGPDGLTLLDAETLRPVVEPVAVPGRVAATELLDDDHAIAVTSQATSSLFGFTAADRWSLVDLSTGETTDSGRLQQPATSIAVAPDGRRLAAASLAGVEIVQLRPRSSVLLGSQDGEAEAEGQLLTYSPDGRLLASADSSGRISLWDGRSSALLGTVQPDNGRPEPMFVDEKTLLLQYPDGALYRWDTSERHAVESACSIVGHGLDREEWAHAFGDRPYVDVCD